ncbi:MAG TPA: prolyl oligopeptidase family serine peptidase, partial [Terriglobia bacterium]|nr:prolyl oligopeptidase family serine peptidase [Terriglobia bacterium]
MRTNRILATFASMLLALGLQSGCANAQSAAASSPPSKPPVAPVRPVTDDYFGTKVVDPYRYMENLKDPEVQAWMKGQNDHTRAVLAGIPGRGQLLARIRELDQSAPAQVSDVRRLPGDVYFYQKLLAGENVGKLYMRVGPNGEERLLLDPEKITLRAPNQVKGGKVIAYFAPSDDANYVAAGIMPGGSEDDTEIHVIETASGRETGDVILRARDIVSPAAEGGVHWLPDGRSFVYGRLQNLPPGAPATELYQKYRAYLHVLGRDPEKDLAVFGYGVTPSIEVDPRDLSVFRVRPSWDYALGVVNHLTPNNAFYIAPVGAIGKSDSLWQKVADFSDQVKEVVIHGDDLYLLTFKNAPRYKIIRTSARRPNLASAETVVPASEGVITNIIAAQDALYVQVLDGGIGRLLRVTYANKSEVEPVTLPFEGSIDLGISDPRMPGTLLTMSSWTKAPRINAYDPQAKHVTDTKLQPAGPYDNPANVEAIEVKVPSYDGTLVPLSIVQPKGLKLDGSNPTFLFAYGSYGFSQDPFFQPFMIAWHERGGVGAICHVRGGGEYGEEWHLAGKGPTKPNTWRDLIACADYLVEKKYTSPARLSGMGGSAGVRDIDVGFLAFLFLWPLSVRSVYLQIEEVAMPQTLPALEGERTRLL